MSMLLFSLPKFSPSVLTFVFFSRLDFPKILYCIHFKAKVPCSGQTAMKGNIKSPFPALNIRKEMLYRRNYKALQNKVNHCGRMPGVDKWRDRNVSTISAICFLSCGFSLLPRHCSLSLCFSSLLSVILLSPCSSFSTESPLVFLSIHVSFSLSHQLSSLSKMLSVRCQRSRPAWCESRESVKTNNRKQKRLI